MRPDPLDGLTVFLSVARHRSFTSAAAELEVTPTAISQRIKQLERRLGVVLFQRTTRRVALTDAGGLLFARARPAAVEIDEVLTALATFRDRPSGTIRLTASRSATWVVAPLVARLHKIAPEIVVEVTVDNAFVDLVAGGFDAGVRLGDAVEKDMVRVQLTKRSAWSIVGAPSYFATMGRPKTPDELTRHRAVRQRLLATGVLYRWELERRGREVTVDVPASAIADDVDTIVMLARDGVGLAYVPDTAIERELAGGTLERVLERHVGEGPGLFLYFPSRSRTQPKLRALIEAAHAASGPVPKSART